VLTHSGSPSVEAAVLWRHTLAGFAVTALRPGCRRQQLLSNREGRQACYLSPNIISHASCCYCCCHSRRPSAESTVLDFIFLQLD
jgi:hypothetical protein